MLGIEVNFLVGRFVATAHDDRDRPEWPPHPARLFSALVATWADSDVPDPRERAALEWLESQEPPSITASPATPRTVVTYFVPVNDAAVVGTALYQKRASKLADVEERLETVLEASAGEVGRTAERLMLESDKLRDVTEAVTRVGNTPVEKARKLLPEHRERQARTFPSVTPDEPRVTYAWAGGADPDVESALDGLLARVSRLGHSSSLVSCRVVHDPPPPDLRPGPGQITLRSVRPGQLATLEREHAKHLASRPRSLPFTTVPYQTGHVDEAVEAPVRADTAGEWLVFELAAGSRRLPATRAVEVARMLRSAVFHHADNPLPEGLTGHREDGSPVQHPHVGFLAIPYVGYERSDGRLMGVAVSLPDRLDPAARTAVLRAIGKWEGEGQGLRLTLGRAGVLDLERLVVPSRLWSLRPGPWSRPSQTWISATPIALPTHPGPLGTGSPAARTRAWARAQQAVIDSCRHIGLPDPIEVTVSLGPLIRGALPARTYPAFGQPGPGGATVARRLVHAAITFAEPVVGPLVLGAGRYLGLGLTRPVENPGDRRE